MLVYITGVPGSGKTYKAVKEIYDHFGIGSPKKDDRFLYCYTNINQFDFSKVDDRVRKLDFDDLRSKLIQLHALYKKKVSDDVLNEKAKEFELYKALFVIDEAHNYFQTRDPILVWWLTYHRHLYQDIYLITQNLALIESKYKPLAEYFYKAVPASLRLNKNVFKYNVFIDSRMSQKSKAQVEKIKFDPKVIELYHSGDTVKAPNFIFRILSIVAIFALFVGVLFYFIYNSLTSKGSDSPPAQPVVSQTVQSGNNSFSHNLPTLSDDYRFIVVTCFNDSCSFADTSFPFSILDTLVNLSESKYLGTEVTGGTNKLAIYILASSQFQNYFKGVPHEKDSSNRRSLSFFSSK